MVVVARALRPVRTNSNWMQTLSGRKFWPTSPIPEEIFLEDVAGALARLCRYGGHCLRFYSVGEHSCHVHDAAPPHMKREALFHDTSEAYLVDIPRPLKPSLYNYAELENGLMLAAADRFGFAWPLPSEVKILDTRIIGDERAQNMAYMDVPASEWCSGSQDSLGIKLQFWSPEQATSEFLIRAYALGVR